MTPPPKKNPSKRKPSRMHTKANKPNTHVVLVDIPKYFILGGLLALMITLIWIISPFIPSIIIGAVIATGFYPIHKRIKKVLKKRTPAAIVSMVILLSIILIPVTWFISYITTQAIDTYFYVEEQFGALLEIDVKLIPEIIENSFVGTYLNQAKEILPIQTEDIVGFATTAIQNISEFLVSQTTNLAKQVSILTFHIFVLLLSMFFFLRDGDTAIQEIKDVIPLANEYREILMNKLQAMSKGILYGIFGASMAQGLLGGIGFSLVGIENAAFWGTIMAFFSLVPYVGATLIWIPAALVLLLTGHSVAALVLVLWGMFVVGTVDNIIKPIVIGESARIHPLLSFLTILGGIFTMGITGLIIAPYILSLALSFLYIYKLEYQSVLNE
jgi:predicted PurR-regulated permease PerM